MIPTAKLLPTGKVLVADGWNGVGLASFELYDPVTQVWTAMGMLGTVTARYDHTATLLRNGKLLLVGGWASDFGILNSAEIYW